MRFGGMLAVALLMLAGCDQIGGTAATLAGQDGAQGGDGDGMAMVGGAFDYRYAYRLPADRVKAVQASNADACARLGPARCAVTAMKYRVRDGNHIEAALTLQLDPLIARNFGDAVSKSVATADGVLVETQVTGSAASNAARSNALITRLRDQLANARAAAAGEGSEAAPARAKAERIRQALETIAEVETGQGQSLATAPVMIRYASSRSLASLGGSPEANFRNAGQTLLVSLAGMADVLAGVGPWIVLLLGGALLLRWLLNRTAEPMAVHVPHHDALPSRERGEGRNPIRRWFARDDADAREPQH